MGLSLKRKAPSIQKQNDTTSAARIIPQVRLTEPTTTVKSPEIEEKIQKDFQTEGSKRSRSGFQCHRCDRAFATDEMVKLHQWIHENKDSENVTEADSTNSVEKLNDPALEAFKEFFDNLIRDATTSEKERESVPD